MRMTFGIGTFFMRVRSLTPCPFASACTRGLHSYFAGRVPRHHQWPRAKTVPVPHLWAQIHLVCVNGAVW